MLKRTFGSKIIIHGIVACFVAVTALYSPSFAQDNSALNRLTKRDELFGWEAVGRLDIHRKGTCTGVLIAKDLVLTAAHCVVSGKPVKPESLTFKAGYRDGVSIAERSVARFVIHARYDPNDPSGYRRAQSDIALLQLDQPVSTGVIDPFVVDYPSSNGKTISVVSYARNRNEALSWQRSCSILGKRDGLIAFDCDVTFGSSGAPVFEKTGLRVRVISLVSRGTRNENGVIAVGMELPKLVNDLKRALRSGRGVIESETSVSPTPQVRNGLPKSGDSSAKFLKP